jgi:predicted regulator of Ras-like GTPase activity (Roadblock/LC7/MglB family)
MERIKAASEGSRSVVPPRTPASPTASGSVTTAPGGTSLEPVAGVLDRLVDEVVGVTGAVLASVDGFGVARSSSMSDEPSHPAMLAAAVGLSRQLAAVGGGEHLRQIVVDHDAGRLLVWPIGEQRVLAVLATAEVDQRQARAFVHDHAAGFAKVGVRP